MQRHHQPKSDCWKFQQTADRRENSRLAASLVVQLSMRTDDDDPVADQSHPAPLPEW